MARGIVLGVVATLVVLALGAYRGLKAGLMPANADGKPSRLERWAARTVTSRNAGTRGTQGSDPLSLDDANLIAGIKLYDANCAVCHGASAGRPSNIALGLYQKPPQLAKDGVEDDPDGVIYWKVAHGIRLTGMPAFGKKLDELPPAPQCVWVRASAPVRSSASR